MPEPHLLTKKERERLRKRVDAAIGAAKDEQRDADRAAVQP